ncbi:P-hydroxybenzoic acid efflux pump subunit [Tasmannia lanceolata]|uniref:P-hydroxybenzoic acid efflux pump subunit n=1 Tax=Tasmannia lanceolata TaxID=3420 RepID=UPI004063ABB5
MPMPMPSPSPSTRTRAVWQSRLGAALRTMLACTIIASVKFYGPARLRLLMQFPGASYVIAILITSEATLGETMIGSFFALYGTLQGAVAPTILSLWLIGPARFSITTTTLVVGLSAFVVALPESTHVITKRVALVQIVLLYVVGFIQGVHMEPVMNPVHVVASSVLGALASVLALVFPFPRLGYQEVRKKSKLFSELSAEKLKLFVNAFCAENNTAAVASISQANSLGCTGIKLLQSIKLKQTPSLPQASIQWETLGIKPASPNLMKPLDRLHSLDMPLKGMEIALSYCPTFPIKMVEEELKHHLFSLSEHISLTLSQLYQRSDSSTAPETTKQLLHESLRPLQVSFPTKQDLPSIFFLFCIKLLHDELLMNPSVQFTSENSDELPINPSVQFTSENNIILIEESPNSHKQEQGIMEKIVGALPMQTSGRRLKTAFKLSLSLGLSVLLGLLFSKENGFWAGITVALSFMPHRETTYWGANVRAQGTVLGSVYGILGGFIPEKFIVLRLLVLLPWFVFTSFLSRSRMYGQAGGISAAIAAILILGRKKYGLPIEFAITRITETFIGLFCLIFVELLLQPTRASTLAKIQLSESLQTLHRCVESMNFHIHGSKVFTCLVELKEEHTKLREHVDELGKYIEEAEVEPNFWFLPFPNACYRKLFSSLSKMGELLLFGFHAMEFLGQGSHRFGVAWKEGEEQINGDLELFKSVVGSSLKCFEEVTRIKSLEAMEMELQRKKKNNSDDLESRKSSNPTGCRVLSGNEDEVEKIVGSFLQHAMAVMTRIHVVQGGEEIKCQVVLCLSALGFCIERLMKETMEIEKGIRELVQWENPSSHINLYEISCKMNDLST